MSQSQTNPGQADPSQQDPEALAALIKSLVVKNGGLFGRGASNDAYAQYFTGRSYLKPVVVGKALPFGIHNVTFEPGCINHWHRHNNGWQILIATGGKGWVQVEGHDPVLLLPGDSFVIHDGEKHWHGAAKDSWFSHLAITTGQAEWLEPVDQAAYDALPADPTR